MTYDWLFPLPRTHTGILQGNGTMGVMVWGGGNVLRITLGRADFWDRRGALPWTEQMNYATIRRLLEAGDEKALRAIFEPASPAPGEPRRPSVLPIGRIELEFAGGCELTRGTLDVRTGQAIVRLRDASGAEHEVRLDLAMDQQVMLVELPAGLPAPTIRRVTSWEYVGEYLASISFRLPALFDDPQLSGWTLTPPADPSVCVGHQLREHNLWITTALGAHAAGARQSALDTVRRAVEAGPDALRAGSTAWWSAYWSAAPRVSIPNANLDFLYNYGMYKFAGLTAPQGVPATLQGPWVEEYQMPPWSSDYHFNINVQMCYWPAYRGNRLEHLRPLLEMVWSWRERLRDNARKFAGIDDGYLLPHAVDDRGGTMGGFWSGTIDHACTGWVAKMMYDYWLYGGDEAFLRDRAYPFMVGAMRVYEEMVEPVVGGQSRRAGSGQEEVGSRQSAVGSEEALVRAHEGSIQDLKSKIEDHLCLPVSVSPEYRGNAMNAWGRNASFQLACVHWLIEALLEASRVLGIEPRPAWREIQRRLPRACLIGGEPGEQIALWEGTPLEESHRHHSHLAGITPFNVLDVDDPRTRQIVSRSIRHWTRMGMGMWSGWCMPWAATIHTFVGNPEASELILEVWQKVFTNLGHGTLHDCDIPGFTLIDGGPERGRNRDREIMQMDAGMGATAAILEMLLHTRRGVNHLFGGASERWADASFENVRTEGGFLVSARRLRGVVSEVRVSASRAGTFRLASPWDAKVIELPMRAGEERRLRRG